MNRLMNLGVAFGVAALMLAGWWDSLIAQEPGKSAVPPKSGAAPAVPPPAARPPAGAQPPAQQLPGAAPAKQAQAMPQGPVTSDDDPRVKAAVQRAANYYRTVSGQLQCGEIALMVHALAKIHEKYPDIVPATDPAFQRAVNALRAYCTTEGFTPSRRGGPDNYEAGCAAMALAAADGQAYKNEIQKVMEYILAKQRPEGYWTYDTETNVGDTSMTQYAILGLWEAASAAGLPVPKNAWDRAAEWLMATQHGDGGFEYHPHPGGQAAEPTHTMTVASLGSLYICRDHLAFGKRRNTRGVLMPVQSADESSDEGYTPKTSPDQFKSALDRANAWIQSPNHFTLEKARGEGDSGGGRWLLYYLYAFERYATLADLKTIKVGGKDIDWYAEGARIILSKQQEEGSWEAGDGREVSTAFAVLFLIRSTKISHKIHQRRLGRGTLISGRGLPQNLADLEQTNTGFKAKAIRGDTGDLLLKITEDPSQADALGRGLLVAMYEEKKKWTAGGEEGAKLRKALEVGYKTKSSELIKATLKALALTGDYKIVPLLIDAMYYEDDAEVQLAARQALCLISRKFNGFGNIYPEEATLEEWKAEIERWKAWYLSVRPEASFEDDIELK